MFCQNDKNSFQRKMMERRGRKGGKAASQGEKKYENSESRLKFFPLFSMSNDDKSRSENDSVLRRQGGS